MPMPKAPMHKNHRLVFRQYNIRLSRQVFYMQPVLEAMRVKKLTNQQFRLGILAFYPAHIAASYFLTVYICHTSAKAKNMQNNSFIHIIPNGSLLSKHSFHYTGKAFLFIH